MAESVRKLVLETTIGQGVDTDIIITQPDVGINSFRERIWIRWAQFFVDVFALQLSFFLGYLFRSSFNQWLPLLMPLHIYRDLSLGMLVVPCGYWFLKLYPGHGLTEVEKLRRRIKGTLVFFMVFTTWNFLTDEGGWSRGVLLAAFAFALVLPPLIQTIFRKILIHADLWGTPVLVLGAAKTGETVVSTLLKEKGLGFRPVAVLDDDKSKWGTAIQGVPVVGGVSHAPSFAGKVNSVILAMPGAGRECHVGLSKHLPFFHIIIVPDLIGLQSLWVEALDFGGVLGLEIQKNLLLRRNWVLKRVMDYLLGAPLFLVSIPILTVLALWIMIVSPGNPFFYQVREGFRGKRIKVWKLRTMYPAAEKLLKQYLDRNLDARREWNCYFKLKNDPRIIKGVGSILRKTSLDELPQLWNVLRGEMSLVGPRPFPHYHLEEFKFDFRNMRRSVLPGITGLWQVSARSDGDLKVQESLDTYYIRNWSIWMDLTLLGQTVWIVLTGKGAY